jgi:Ras-related protein Rab-1A
MKWVKSPPGSECPAGRVGHSFHAIGPDEIILFGGFKEDPHGAKIKMPFGPWIHSVSLSNELFVLNTQSFEWRRIESSGDIPSARGFHASSYNVRSHQLVVHGGWTNLQFNSESLSNDLFTLDLTSMVWSRTALSGSQVPTPRAAHRMVYNSKDDSYLLFGDDKMGDSTLYRMEPSGVCNEVVTLGPRPLGRRFSSLHSVGSRLYCFGGETILPGITDMYVLNLSNNQWTKPLYEGSLSLRAHAACILNDKVMVYGGVREKGNECVIAKKLFFLTVLEIRDSKNDSFKFKIVTVGDSGVGKSCLLTRFVTDMYSDFHVSTIGVDYKTVVTMVRGKLARLILWDTAGQERFSVVTGNYYRNADAFVIVYDATCRASFEHVDKWLGQIREHHECGPNTVKLLCANKTDLVNELVVTESEGKAKAGSIGALFVATSARTSGNVDLAFLSVAQNLVDMRKAIQEQTTRTSPIELGSGLNRRNGQINCCV